MRVAWVILTLGLLWTAQGEGENSDNPTQASGAASITTTNSPTSTAPATVKPTLAAPSTTPIIKPINEKAMTKTSVAPSQALTSAGQNSGIENDPQATAEPSQASGAASITTTNSPTSTAPAAVKPTLAASSTTPIIKPTDGKATTKTSVAPSQALTSAGQTTTLSVSATAVTPSVKSPTTAPDTTTTVNKQETTHAGGGILIPTTQEGPGTPHNPNTTTNISTNTKNETGESVVPVPGHVSSTAQPRTTVTTGTTPPTTKTVPPTTTQTLPPTPIPFNYVINKDDPSDNPTAETFYKLCSKYLEMVIRGNCSISGKTMHDGSQDFNTVIIHGQVNISVVKSHYEELVKKPDEIKEPSEQSDYTTLIAILASCGAVALIIMGLAIYTYRHGKNYRKNQQHLTEELQTVENGYHDNPTLEVMEVQPETAMEKRPNGEFNDSWIVPMDNLLKDGLADEEDTHL